MASAQELARKLQENEAKQYHWLRSIVNRVEVGADYVKAFIKYSAYHPLSLEMQANLFTLQYRLN